MKRIRTKVLSFVTAFLLACALVPQMPHGAFAADAYSFQTVKITSQTFPDDTFRAYVSNTFDTNKNGTLDSDEILVARNIYCDKMGIKTLKGIEYLAELRGVYASFNELTELDLSKNPEITGVWVSNNNFTKLDFSANAKTLEWVYCFDNNSLKTLNLNGCKKLSYLECSECNLGKLDVSQFPELEHLICASCGLSSLDLSKNTKLTHLDAFNNPDNGFDYPLNNKLTKLDLSHNPKMKRLDIWANYDLKSVDVSVCPGLQYYNCAMTGVSALDLSKNPELNKLNCSYNKNLTKLDLSKNPKMACLICNDSPIKSLDLTHNPYMRYLHAGLCSFTSINIGSCPYLLKTYNDGIYAKEYMHFSDGDVPVGHSWTINYGGDDSTGKDQIFYIWLNEDVKISTKATVDIADLFPDRDSNITDTSELFTREAFVNILYEMAGRPGVTGLKSRFKDVQAGSWYEDALLWGEKNAICVGYPYSTADVFGVGKYISRQDAVLMLMRYSEYKDYERAIDFGRSDDYLDYYDVDYDHWEAVCWSATWHIMEGKGEPGAPKSEQVIDPYGKATVSELETMIANLYDVNKINAKVPEMVSPADISINMIRLSGSTRYGTAAAISKAAYPGTASTVILTNGTKFVDALAGVPLASAYDAPILLTEKDSLPSDTLNEIKRLKATNVIILGGEGAVSAKIETVLTKGGIKSGAITRIKGLTRYETSVNIAKQLQAKTGKAPSEIFFTSSEKFADALSVSSVTALKKAPIIYVPKSGSIDKTAHDYVKSLKGKVKNAYFIGGKGVISDEVFNTIANSLGLKSGSTIVRIKGSDRYETCVAVNNKFAGLLTAKGVCIATGENFPDALAGGVFAAKNKVPIMLASGALSSSQSAFLKQKAARNIYIFGGKGAVPESLVNIIAKASA